MKTTSTGESLANRPRS